MAKFLLAKIASVATLISTSMLVSGCGTSAGKPILCDSGTVLKNGECVRVAKVKPARPYAAKPSRAGSEY